MTRLPQPSKDVVLKELQPLEPGYSIPDLLSTNEECCYILLSLIESSRNAITQYPSQFPEGHSQEIALQQLDNCEKWVKSKLNEP